MIKMVFNVNKIYIDFYVGAKKFISHGRSKLILACGGVAKDSEQRAIKRSNIAVPRLKVRGILHFPKLGKAS